MYKNKDWVKNSSNYKNLTCFNEQSSNKLFLLHVTVIHSFCFIIHIKNMSELITNTSKMRSFPEHLSTRCTTKEQVDLVKHRFGYGINLKQGTCWYKTHTQQVDVVVVKKPRSTGVLFRRVVSPLQLFQPLIQQLEVWAGNLNVVVTIANLSINIKIRWIKSLKTKHYLVDKVKYFHQLTLK